MAEVTNRCTKLSDALDAFIDPAFDAKALLQGALSLLSKEYALPDRRSDIWAARRLIEKASEKIDEFYGDKEIALRTRIIELEEAAA